MNKILIWLRTGVLLNFINLLWSAQVYSKMIYVFMPPVTIAIITSGILLYRRHLYARHFTRAWAAYMLAVFVFSLRSVGIVPPGIWGHYIMEIGQSMEAILLSFALGARISDLQFRATKDFLTGLKNRSALKDYLDFTIDQMEMNGSTNLHVLVIDLDDFKKINDEFGHENGDRVLKRAANLLRENIRGEDFLARWGGEEFVVVLPGTDKASAESVAEKLRKVIEENLHLNGVNITASLGCTGFIAKDSSRTMFHRADQAMYVAKKGGKNQVVVTT